MAYHKISPIVLKLIDPTIHMVAVANLIVKFNIAG